MKKKHKHKMISRDVVENAMIDTTRLRAALLLACTELTGGDPIEAWGLAETFYDEAPKLLAVLSAETVEKMPGGPAKVVPFPAIQQG
ncbi:MAG: hypothetical protein J0H83_03515 [Candidatus Melainabacteria bacterium]|nr:hypothetical protein [Candidatus Melainabacteria bacterium]